MLRWNPGHKLFLRSESAKVGEQFLQLGVLVLQCLQALDLRHLHAAVFANAPIRRKSNQRVCRNVQNMTRNGL